jgi:hypothetical protein
MMDIEEPQGDVKTAFIQLIVVPSMLFLLEARWGSRISSGQISTGD